ncbi:hypothetical protein HDU76_010479 [Blyttiomyces sp. JEL0837]|nr:hypothetical protein HDU76_010479 [Blyttiomyces sp. JEL0837]
MGVYFGPYITEAVKQVQIRQDAENVSKFDGVDLDSKDYTNVRWKDWENMLEYAVDAILWDGDFEIDFLWKDGSGSGLGYFDYQKVKGATPKA